MPSITILLADDHRLFRQGLRQICEIKGRFEVVGEAENGHEAVRLAHELRPDMILMDIHMPELDGIQAISQIIADNPKARIITLTMYGQQHYVFAAIKAGASGYLLKDTDADELLDAIRRVARGEALVDPIMAAKVLDEFRRLSRVADAATGIEQLSDGEMVILRLVADGASNEEIATRLHLSVQTVANRLRTIFQKLQVNSRTQAALYALRKGWATLGTEQ